MGISMPELLHRAASGELGPEDILGPLPSDDEFSGPPKWRRKHKGARRR